MSRGCFVERAAQTGDLRVDVKTVDRVDTERQYFLGVFFHAACRGAEKRNVNIAEVADIFHHFIWGQFGRLVFFALAAYDASYLKVGGSLKGLKCVVADISISNHGCSDFLHNRYGFISGGMRRRTRCGVVRPWRSFQAIPYKSLFQAAKLVILSLLNFGL